MLGIAACSSDSSASSKPPSRGEIAQLLTRHGHAVLDNDRKAFLADLRAGRFRNRQEAVFDNLSKVPLTRWSYTIGPRVDATDAQRDAQKKYDSSALIVRVSLRYALAGVDRTPTSHDLWWTFVRRNGQVQVVGDDDLSTAGGVSWQGPWDFGPLTVVRGRSCLVLGHVDNLGVLRAAASTVDASVPVVTSVWGTEWSRQVAVIVPSSPAELEAALGPTSSITAEVGAIAKSDGQDATSGAVLGQRLVVEAEPFGRLSATGQRIVLQHEITHIAAARQTSGATPRWLAEGFAEYVGNLGSGQPVRTAAAELGRDVRRAQVPRGLPADAAFDTSSTAAQAYQSSWLACRLIAGRAGPGGLVRFYRAVGASPKASEVAVAAALAAVLHETPARFVARVRAYLVAQLG